MVQREALDFLQLGAADYPRMRELMKQYKDLPMDLADSAPVRVAEREKLRELFTLDKRDFSVYRPAHVKRLVIVPD